MDECYLKFKWFESGPWRSGLIFRVFDQKDSTVTTDGRHKVYDFVTLNGNAKRSQSYVHFLKFTRVVICDF